MFIFLKTRKKSSEVSGIQKSEVMDLQIDSSLMTLVSACSSDKKCALNLDLFSNCTVVLYFSEHLVQIQAILMTWFSLGQRVQVNLCQKLLFSGCLFLHQYNDRLIIELQVQYMKIPSSKHGEDMLCTEIVYDILSNLCTHVLPIFWKNKSF